MPIVKEITLSPSGIHYIILDWTSDASGNATVTTVKSYTAQLAACCIIPGSGSSAPSDQFDVTIIAQDGLDILCNAGKDLSNTSSTLITSGLPVIESTLTVTVTNAGDSKSGRVVLVLKPLEILP